MTGDRHARRFGLLRYYREVYGVQVGSWRIYVSRPFQVWRGDEIVWQWKAGWKP